MAYIELDKKKIARLRKEAQQFQDDIVCAVGTNFMETVAEAENRMIFDILNGLESEPTADVVETEILKEHLRNLTGMFTDELGFVLSLNVVLDAIDFVREKRKEGGAE
jgi:hypothetical protein